MSGPLPEARREGATARWAAARAPWGVLALAAIILLLPLVASEYYLNLLNVIGLGAIVAIGLVLLTGFTGLASLGHAAFYGVGAYASAILATSVGLNPWLSILGAAVITAGVAYAVGIPTLRLSGHYLTLATIALSVIAEQLFRELKPLTGGADGYTLSGSLNLFGQDLAQPSQIYYLIWAVVLVAAVLAINLVDSRAGRAMRGLRSSEDASAALGVPVASLKLRVFVLSAVLASVAGSLFAYSVFYVSPGSFSLAQSIRFLTMAVVGGTSSVWGALLGAGLVQFLDSRLQDVLPALLGREGRYEVIVYGLLLAGTIIVAPQGLWALVTRPFRALGAQPSVPVGEGLAQPASRPPTAAPLLELRAASKAFGGLMAVNELSFAVQAGQIVGLIGPNGAGKSTAFNLITGVHSLTAGEVLYRGEPISSLLPHQIARLGVLRSFQNTALFESMNVLENATAGTYSRTSASFLRCLLHLERAEDGRARAEGYRALQAVRLEGSAFAPSATLPVGQRRLLEVARALAGAPDLLLLDEPAAGLRYGEKAELIELLRSLRAGGLTILLVEHDMELVMRLADRIVVMSYGQKIAEGTPDEVRRDRAVIEAYLGREHAA